MITVCFSKNKITITGHAGYAEHGKDIVCAAVSTLTQTFIASVQELTEDVLECKMQPGDTVIKFRNPSERTLLLVDSFFVGIRMISESYPNNVWIVQA